MVTKMRGLVADLESEAHPLPLNAELRANNVYEIPVDPSPIEAARALYGQHIAPRVSMQHGSFRSRDLAFHVNRPDGWGSDISWWSRMMQTYRYFNRIFLKVSPRRALHRLIDIDGSSFTVRSLSRSR